jgi:uncharacterized protein (DUF4415 family)
MTRRNLSDIETALADGQDQSVAAPPEADALGVEFWEKAIIRMPQGKTSIHLRVDTPVLEWFRAQGDGHLTRMNAVLSAYVDAQKSRNRS